MRRSVLLIAGCMLSLLVGAGPALADAGPHVKGQGLTPDTCAACHRAHTGQAPYLLKEKQEQLCFSCHGSAGTGSKLDVQDGVGYSSDERIGKTGTAVGALRGGGFKYALISSSEAGVEKTTGAEGSHGIPTTSMTIKTLSATELQPSTSAHSVDESNQMAWGNGAISATSNYGKEIKLTCGSCHDPHGNGMYRILRPEPNESGATKPGVEILETAEMKEESHTKNHVYTTANYWESWDTNDTAFEAKISSWCATCHTRLGANDEKVIGGEAEVETEGGEVAACKGQTTCATKGAKQIPFKSEKWFVPVSKATYSTESGDAVFNYRHRTEWPKYVWEEVAAEHAAGKYKVEPNCIQCHVAHGTDATMGGHAETVAFPGGKLESETNPLVTKPEESFLLRLNNRGVCQTCHNK